MPSRLSRGLLAVAVLLCGAASSRAAIFEPLFVVTKVVGEVRVERPNGTSDLVRKDYAYPYGSRLVVPAEVSEEVAKAAAEEGAKPENPQVWVKFGRDFLFGIGPGSDVRILDETTGDGDEVQEIKVIDMQAGSVETRITAAVKKNGGTLDEKAEKNLSAVIVRTPVADCTRLAERNTITVEKDPENPDYFNCFFLSQGGWMEIHGPQFDLDHLKRATRVRIGGNRDFTSITPESGEFTGTFEKGADNNEKVFFRTRVVAKIFRSHAQVGGRLVVAVMVSYPDGQRKTYAYLEGQTGVDAGSGPTTELAQLGSDGETAEEGGGDWGGDSTSDGDEWGGDSSSGGDDWGGGSGDDDDFGNWSFE